MQWKTGLFAVALAFSAAPLSAQITRTDPRDRRPTTSGGTIGDVILGRVDTTSNRRDACRVRDAVTPDGRVVQICDDRRVQNTRRRDDDDDDDDDHKGRRRSGHVNDRDGDGDFDAHDRAIRKRQHELAKAEKKRLKAARKSD